MTAETLFEVANPLAMTGWIVLLAFPIFPRIVTLISGFVIPLVLSLAYTALILVFWTQAEGGFDSLTNVQLLFTQPEIALAGWVHFLAFDLFLGGWEARDARNRGIHHLAIIPSLALTFMFGPLGFLSYIALREVLTLKKGSIA